MGRHKSHRSRFSWIKLLLGLALPACLVAAVWTGNVLFFTRQIDTVLGTLVFVVEVGLSIWVMYLLRGSRYRRRTPSFKLVFFSLLGIALVCGFAGIEPLASYKDVALDYARSQGDKVAEFFQEATPVASPPESQDVTSAVAKVEPAVVMVEVEDGMGSGMIVDKSGYILTSNHIVENVQSATIILMGGGRYQGTVIAKDEIRDLAIVKITAIGFDFPVVPLGHSDALESGEEVIAVGYSLGLEGGTTISKGIISAFRDEEGVRYIQTDAAINPGNSGGPLINLKGEVIGIVTWKVVHEAVEGMGFAVAINSAKTFIAGLREEEQVKRELEDTQGRIEAVEQEVLLLVNLERASRNTKGLTWDSELHRIASEHSQEMATQGRLFHSSMYEAYAENCWGGGPGSFHYFRASDIVTSWMGSDKHRTWLLCPHLKHVGVGIALSDEGVYASWTFWRRETSYSDWWYVNGSGSPPDWWH